MILGIIPARAGSKRIPHKNIRLLLGKPLIAYTISSALKSRLLDKIIISTDSIKIAKIAKIFGAEVPFIRPKYLAQDKTPMVSVVQHAVKRIEKLYDCKVDVIVLLQPTSPFRLPRDIDNGVRKILKTNAGSVIGVCMVPYLSHPYLIKKIKGDRLFPYLKLKQISLRPQNIPNLYQISGVLYVVRRDTIMNEGTFFGKDVRAIVIDHARSIDIDTVLDFKIAEAILKNLKVLRLNRPKDVRKKYG